MIYKIEKPEIIELSRTAFSNLLSKYIQQKEEFDKLYQKTLTPNYNYWDKIKYIILPDGIKKEEFWHLVKFLRRSQSNKTIIKSEKGEYFTWLKLPNLEKFLHEIDLNTGGSLFSFTGDIDESNKQKFLTRGVMEEAIASSQLEGANTTRKVAKTFLREGRKARTKSEQMILNNYESMQAVENDYKNKKIDLNIIFELHALITKNTIKEEEVGRLRKDDDNILITNKHGVIFHIPPKEKFLNEEINKLIKFANDDLEGEFFIHPLIKAIMIHFWVGYLHPFTDGNGRLARLLFYWYLLKKGYWAFAYLPISKKIKESPIQYGNSYVYSEQDDLDMTYFIDYNIKKIELSLTEFRNYVDRKTKENLLMSKLSKTKYKFNDRQIQLLQFLYKNPTERTSIKIHMKINQISRHTAYTDLRELNIENFIKSEKIKKNVYYYGTDNIRELFD